MIHPILAFKKLHPDAIIPQYQTRGSSGFDFHALITAEEDSEFCLFDFRLYDADEINPHIIIDSQKRAVISTGLAAVIPDGWEIQIRPRSGLAAKYGITIVNSPGTVDSDYLGEIKIVLLNTGEDKFTVKNGDRIAQGVMGEVQRFILAEIEDFSEIGVSADMGGGFGSTGL